MSSRVLYTPIYEDNHKNEMFSCDFVLSDGSDADKHVNKNFIVYKKTTLFYSEVLDSLSQFFNFKGGFYSHVHIQLNRKNS